MGGEGGWGRRREEGGRREGRIGGAVREGGRKGAKNEGDTDDRKAGGVRASCERSFIDMVGAV